MKKFELPRTPAQWLEAIMNAIFFLCGILAVGCVAVITVYMFLSGLPAIGKIGPLKFLFGTEWASTAVRAEVRHPALCALQHLRHAGRVPHRRAGGPADSGVPLEGRSTRRAQRGASRRWSC